MPDVDAIVIPVGGGGLIAGVALAVKTMKPDVKIIGVKILLFFIIIFFLIFFLKFFSFQVEPEACPSFSTALRAGKPVLTHTDASLADGLYQDYFKQDEVN